MTEKPTELQEKLLRMLEWFHGFCVEHELTYYAIGGTLLGAVRHGGFIPWDDDIDIGMPRRDYVRFLETVKDSGSQYRAETIADGNKDFPYRLCKLYDTATTVEYNTKYKTKRGIFLDIFPLDGAGNTREESVEYYGKIKKRLFLVSAKTYKLNGKKSFARNLAIVFCRALPFNWRKYTQKTHEICAKKDFYESAYVGNLFGRWHEREIVERGLFGKPTLKKFENIEIYCPENSDGYLTAIYGDYMTPPPESKRKPTHEIVSMDLNNSYHDGEPRGGRENERRKK